MTGLPGPEEIFPFPLEPISGKRILVTGGTTGIGRSTALLLASQDAQVMTFGRHQAELDSVVEEAGRHGMKISGMTADVADRQDIERVFSRVDEEWSGLDVLVNNAGLASGDVASTSYDDMDYVVRTNLIGYMACAHAAVRRMGETGTIVNVGSMSATVREEGSSVYVATKAGIEGFSEALRKELNPSGIRVCLIEPGAVGTDMQPASPDEQRVSEEKLEMLTPQDIALSVLFCLIQPSRSDVVLVRLRPHLQLI